MFGQSFDKPVRHMREYLSILLPLVHEGTVSFRGETLSANGTLNIAGATPFPVLIAALGPKMLELAGTVADGTITWMTGPATLESHTVPAITKAAEQAGRPPPRVCVGLPVCVTDDPDDARERADQLNAHGRIGMCFLARQNVEREGQQAVARKDRGCFVEGLVRRRPPTPQIVIVHRRQVVMHERIAVHELDRAPDHQRPRASPLEQPGRLHHQKRAETLASGKRRMAHRLEQARRSCSFVLHRIGCEQTVEQTLHVARDTVEPFLENRIRRRDRVDIIGLAQQVSPHPLAHRISLRRKVSDPSPFVHPPVRHTPPAGAVR